MCFFRREGLFFFRDDLSAVGFLLDLLRLCAHEGK
jgi:hypothetical protein